MLTTGTGASGEMRVTSPQINSSSITSPNTTMRQRRALVRISSARLLVSVSKVIDPAQQLLRRSFFCDSIDCPQDSLDRHAQNTLWLFEFGTEVTVAGLARQLLAHDLTQVGGPWSPVRHVR